MSLATTRARCQICVDASPVDAWTIVCSARTADDNHMGSPRVRCNGCDRTWHSVTLADGLRLIGSCPRCGGELAFLGEPPVATVDRVEGFSNTLLPHLVLGPPKR